MVILSGPVYAGSSVVAGQSVSITTQGDLNVLLTPWTLNNTSHSLTYTSLAGCISVFPLEINGSKAGTDTVICENKSTFEFTGLPASSGSIGVWTSDFSGFTALDPSANGVKFNTSNLVLNSDNF